MGNNCYRLCLGTAVAAAVLLGMGFQSRLLLPLQQASVTTGRGSIVGEPAHLRRELPAAGGAEMGSAEEQQAAFPPHPHHQQEEPAPRKGNGENPIVEVPNILPTSPAKAITKTQILVTGTGHSGTSVVMGLLLARDADIDSVTKNVGHIDKYHPSGIFEDSKISRLNDMIMQHHHINIGDLRYISNETSSMNPRLLEQVRWDVDIVKDPRFVFTFPYWWEAASRQGKSIVVPVIAYRHPSCACDHPNCPNCGGDCYVRHLSHMRRIQRDIMTKGGLVFDVDAFFSRPYQYYREFLQRLGTITASAGLDYPTTTTTMSEEQFGKFYSPRSPCNSSLTLGDVHMFSGREARVTQELVDVHWQVKHCSNWKQANTVVVTALWDIGRETVGDGRGFDKYLDWILKTLQINAAMVLFAEADTIARVRPERDATGYPTCYVPMSFEEHPYYDRYFVANNLTVSSDAYRTKVQHPQRVEVQNPKYNILQWGKIELMRLSLLEYNPFQSSSVIWLDAGIARFMPKVVPSHPFPDPAVAHDIFAADRFVVSTSHPTDRLSAICPGHSLWKSSSFLIGGVLGASKAGIEHFSAKWESYLSASLGQNTSANDQIMLMSMWCEAPDFFRFVQTRPTWNNHVGLHQTFYGKGHSYQIIAG